jgi:hypothetical protein
VFDFLEGDDLDVDGDEPAGGDLDGDDAFDAELAEATMVYCPYCGEFVELLFDASGGENQEYVEDCEVCCQPWSVRVSIDQHGGAHVEVNALDE